MDKNERKRTKIEQETRNNNKRKRKGQIEICLKMTPATRKCLNDKCNRRENKRERTIFRQ